MILFLKREGYYQVTTRWRLKATLHWRESAKFLSTSDKTNTELGNRQSKCAWISNYYRK